MSTNNPMTQERLDAIRERVGKSSWAEEEPWAVYDDGLTVSVWVKNGSAPVTFVADRFLRGEDNGEADATLTAHAPKDLADLLAEVERLRALPPVDEDMVERGKAAHHEAFNAWKAKRSLEDAENRRVAAMRAALDAALGTEEGS